MKIILILHQKTSSFLTKRDRHNDSQSQNQVRTNYEKVSHSLFPTVKVSPFQSSDSGKHALSPLTPTDRRMTICHSVLNQSRPLKSSKDCC